MSIPFTDPSQIWHHRVDPNDVYTNTGVFLIILPIKIGYHSPNSRQVVYTYKLNFIWIGYGVTMWGEKLPKHCNFRQIYTVGGGLCLSPFTDPSQIWHHRVDQWPTFACQISSESIYCVALHGRKAVILDSFSNLRGSCTQPSTNEDQLRCAKVGPWLSMLTCQILFKLDILLHSGGEKTQILVFFGLDFL